VLAYVLFKDKIGGNPNQTLPVLINELIPVGLKGLIAAGLLAALMSTIAGALNSAATLVSIDIVRKLRPGIPDRKLVRIGRITACLVMVAAMAWSTQGGRFESIFKGLNAMIACLAPPITAVFLGGVFWRRGTQQAALATLVFGFMLGSLTFLLDFPPTCHACLSVLHQLLPGLSLPSEQGYRLITDGLGIPFMLQAWWLFVICSGVLIVASLSTPPPRSEQIEGLCWERPWEAIVAEPWQGARDPRLITIVLATLMAGLYWVLA
jgi:SSS family solute:Na+ symporter